jgi:hypothetical protein
MTIIEPNIVFIVICHIDHFICAEIKEHETLLYDLDKYIGDREQKTFTPLQLTDENHILLHHDIVKVWINNGNVKMSKYQGVIKFYDEYMRKIQLRY